MISIDVEPAIINKHPSRPGGQARYQLTIAAADLKKFIAGCDLDPAAVNLVTVNLDANGDLVVFVVASSG